MDQLQEAQIKMISGFALGLLAPFVGLQLCFANMKHKPVGSRKQGRMDFSLFD